jgi:hypothetical protein
MSAEDALKKYCAKHWKRQSRAHRRNNHPEADLKTEVLGWLKSNGFSCHSIESKAVYSARAGRYVRGQTAPGVADIFGCAPNGIGVFIELKAPGRLSTLKHHQRDFLVAKICFGAFGACIDSVAGLAGTWTEFLNISATDIKRAQEFLIDSLPAAKPDEEGWPLK